MFEIKGFHTCREEGAQDDIAAQVPFLSRYSGQWLGQGYYFWTELEEWARDWLPGKAKVISRYHLSVPKMEMLDLVGSLEDQQEFSMIIDRFRKGSFGKKYRSKFGDIVTISSLISWLREEKGLGFEDIFPYWAVRAKDNRHRRHFPYRKGHPEELFLVERHQMCVYAEYKDKVVTFEGFTYPPHFTDDNELGGVA